MYLLVGYLVVYTITGHWPLAAGKASDFDCTGQRPNGVCRTCTIYRWKAHRAGIPNWCVTFSADKKSAKRSSQCEHQHIICSPYRNVQFHCSSWPIQYKIRYNTLVCVYWYNWMYVQLYFYWIQQSIHRNCNLLNSWILRLLCSPCLQERASLLFVCNKCTILIWKAGAICFPTVYGTLCTDDIWPLIHSVEITGHHSGQWPVVGWTTRYM